jgi:hypothetical protein
LPALYQVCQFKRFKKYSIGKKVIIVRPTASLAKRMKVKLKETDLKSDTKLGDWFCNDIVLDKKQFILCVSSASRLGIVIHAAPYSSFPLRIKDALSELLHAIGANAKDIQSEIEKMDDIVITKTNDKSILGTMKEHHLALEYFLYCGNLSVITLQVINLYLAKNISSKLPELYPKDRALKLISENVIILNLKK